VLVGLIMVSNAVMNCVCRESCLSRLFLHAVFACSWNGSHWLRCLMSLSLTVLRTILCRVRTTLDLSALGCWKRRSPERVCHRKLYMCGLHFEL